jgi:hypothetical protein
VGEYRRIGLGRNDAGCNGPQHRQVMRAVPRLPSGP